MTEKKPTFRKWLKANGAEVLPTKSAWEDHRFRAGNSLHIVYQNKKGRFSFSSRETMRIVVAFEDGRNRDLSNPKEGAAFDLIDLRDNARAWT